MSDVEEYRCCVCGSVSAQPEINIARSNVRKFREEKFTLWRCGSCRSIHSADEVNLDEYYKYYPFFKQTLNAPVRMGYRGLTRRLRRAGLQKHHKIIDFGCGSGLLVEFLKQRGYDAVGFDRYSDAFKAEHILDHQYDLVIAQDVVEHSPDPMGLLEHLSDLIKPGGLIAIGTPNASGIDLQQPEKYVHPLHQPYHRHILSIEALREKAGSMGWRVEAYYTTPYTNMPVLSLPFLHHYMRCFDGCIDVLFEPQYGSGKLWKHPMTAFWLMAGYFMCDDADIVAIFRKG